MIVIQLTLNEYLSYTWHWWWTRLSVCLIKQIWKQPWEENNHTSAFVEICCRGPKGSTMTSSRRVEVPSSGRQCFQDCHQQEIKCWQRGRQLGRGVSIQDLVAVKGLQQPLSCCLFSPSTSRLELKFRQSLVIMGQICYFTTEDARVQGYFIAYVCDQLRILRQGECLHMVECFLVAALHTIMPFSLQRQVGIFCLQNLWPGAERACL